MKKRKHVQTFAEIFTNLLTISLHELGETEVRKFLIDEPNTLDHTSFKEMAKTYSFFTTL